MPIQNTYRYCVHRSVHTKSGGGGENNSDYKKYKRRVHGCIMTMRSLSMVIGGGTIVAGGKCFRFFQKKLHKTDALLPN